MSDLLLILEAPQANLRLAVCSATQLARDAARRHALAPGSAGALAQALCGSLLMAATDRPDAPAQARVDLQLEVEGPLRGLLVDADGSGAVRGLVRVGVLDRHGGRTDGAEKGPVAADGEGASAGRDLQFSSEAPLGRFDAGKVLGQRREGKAGVLSILRRGAGADDLHRGAVPFTGGDLGAGLSAFLRADRELAGELALEVLFRPDEPLAAVAGAMVLPVSDEDRDRARGLGEILRIGAFHEAVARVEAQAPGNAHALAQDLAEALQLGPLRIESELRPRFACRCSRERVVRALQSLGAPELRDMAAKDNGAALTCDFCAQTYRVTANELLDLAGEQKS